MRRVLFGLLVCVLAGAGVLVAQGVHHSTTDVFDFVNGFQLNGGTIITGTTGAQNSAVVLPANSIGGTELSGITMNAVFCGEANENGTVYLGPDLAGFGGDGGDSTIGGTVCDALENATEATADGPLFANVAYKVAGMYCRIDGTLAGTETAVFTMRSAEAGTTPALTCTVAAAQTDCRTLTGTTTNIAAGATVAVQMTQTSNNGDGENGRCVVTIALQ
jgi:hypothetical protein